MEDLDDTSDSSLRILKAASEKEKEKMERFF